ncbi:lambda-exonuclease family protein [Coprococcus comes]|uniref:lambda-exonuclease family protein n=1 Tax=Coprococcus comes TaxID=410072 RepID=UPI0034A5B6E2
MEPYKIYDFEDEKAWLKGRLNGIGGSDASAVVGKNPYKTNIELFEEKTGRRIVPDISEKPYVIYGKEAEQYIRELFRLDYPQYQVMQHEYRILQSLDYPFMQASLDGELVDQDGRKGILEIKTRGLPISRRESWKQNAWRQSGKQGKRKRQRSSRLQLIRRKILRKQQMHPDLYRKLRQRKQLQFRKRKNWYFSWISVYGQPGSRSWRSVNIC